MQLRSVNANVASIGGMTGQVNCHYVIVGDAKLDYFKQSNRSNESIGPLPASHLDGEQ